MERKPTSRPKAAGLSLIELLAIVATLALLVSTVLPALARTRQMSQRNICTANLNAIGWEGRLYAENHNGRWMVPGFRSQAINNDGIEYTQLVGEQRTEPSLREDLAGMGGSTRVSTTRAF